MQFDVKKCYAMSISHKKVPLAFSYSMNDCVLERVKNYPFLGVTISDNLSWSGYIHNVICKSNRTLGLLRRNLWNCKSEVKDTAYKYLVRPQLEYACAVWDPHLKNDSYNIEMVQRRAAGLSVESAVAKRGSFRVFSRNWVGKPCKSAGKLLA